MKKTLHLILIVISLISCNQSKTDSILAPDKKEIIIDLKSIVGKSKTEAEKILGIADNVESFSESSTPCKSIPCEKAIYQKDKFEIIFINGKADWITINDLSKYDFDADGIELFGLSKSDPDFENPQDVIRWKNIENISEVSIFNNGSDKIAYAYIKVEME